MSYCNRTSTVYPLFSGAWQQRLQLRVPLSMVSLSFFIYLRRSQDNWCLSTCGQVIGNINGVDFANETRVIAGCGCTNNCELCLCEFSVFYKLIDLKYLCISRNTKLLVWLIDHPQNPSYHSILTMIELGNSLMSRVLFFLRC